MNYIYILFFTELVFICISLLITRKNILSPSLVSYVMFAFGTLCVIYNVDFWDVNYSFKAYYITVLGFIAMILPELIINRSYQKTYFDASKYMKIKIDAYVNIMIICACVLLTLLFIYETIRHGKNAGATGLYVIGAAKYDETEGISFIGKIALRFTQIMFYFYCYVIFNNLIKCKVKIKKMKSYFIPIFCYLAVMFIGGNRLGLVKIMIAVFCFVVAMNYQIVGVKNFDSKALIKKVIVIGVILLFVFYGMRTISKVGSYTGSRTFTEYITYYIGSPIYLFSKYLDNPSYVHGVNEYWGEQCFTGIYDSLGIVVNGNNNFIKVGGDSNFAGNACTWFQRPINDFGVLGMLVFTFLAYYFFSHLLYKKVLRNPMKINNYSLIIISFFYFVVVMSFYYCQICWALTTWNVIIIICIILSVRYIPKLTFGGKK